jgi:hypothetical protein
LEKDHLFYKNYDIIIVLDKRWGGIALFMRCKMVCFRSVNKFFSRFSPVWRSPSQKTTEIGRGEESAG